MTKMKYRQLNSLNLLDRTSKVTHSKLRNLSASFTRSTEQ